jgi:hypothetical protein
MYYILRSYIRLFKQAYNVYRQWILGYPENPQNPEQLCYSDGGPVPAYNMHPGEYITPANCKALIDIKVDTAEFNRVMEEFKKDNRTLMLCTEQDQPTITYIGPPSLEKFSCDGCAGSVLINNRCSHCGSLYVPAGSFTRKEGIGNPKPVAIISALEFGPGR